VAELRGVTKAYGRGGAARTPLRGLDARFAAGRLCAVTGRSGSGKSTLLHLLAGLERPSDGEVVVAGEALAGLDRAGLAAFRRRHVALVTQEPGLVPFLGAAENVRLGLELRGVDEAEADARAERWLTRLGLGERLRQRVDRLSAGERQRVALARALAAEPALLLADEPTSRLDQASAREVAATLRAAAAEGGVAVVVATHEPLLVEAADELLPLDRHGNLPAA
jgi:ABC-type lipoprotein export system ATPase subunit